MRWGISSILIIVLLFNGVGVLTAADTSLSTEAEILLLGARNALKAGDREKALRRYRTFLEHYPESVEGHRELGWLLIENGDQEEGRQHLQIAGVDFPTFGELPTQAVESLLFQRRFGEAKKELETLLERFPNDFDVQVLLADYYVQRHRFLQAERLYQSLLGTSVDKESRMGLVNVALARGDLGSASQYLNELPEQYPQDPYIHKHQVLLWGRQGRIASAYNQLPKIHETPLRMLAEAELLNITGQHYAAEKRFSELSAEKSGDYAVQMGLVYAYLGQHDEEKAVSALEAVLQQFPEDLEAQLLLAETLIHQRRWQAGKDQIAQVLHEEPDILEAVYLNHRVDRGNTHVDQNWWRDVVKSPGEALRAKQLLARFKDWHGIRDVSSRFIRDSPQATSVFPQWTRAMILTGRASEGLVHLRTLREQSAQDMKVSVATLRAHQGQQSAAITTLQAASPTLESGHLYQQLEQHEDAKDTYSAVLQRDRESTLAQIGVITSLVMVNQNTAAEELLTRLFDDCPQNGWPALANLLVYAKGTNPSYQILLQKKLKARHLDEDASSLDMRLTYLALLAQQGRYAEVAQHYQGLYRDNPRRPDVALGLARSLVQDQDSREMHETRPVIEAYDRYLVLKPYDVVAWTEKARFLGWESKHAEAEREYEAILAKFPKEESVRLELSAKRELWRQHERQAFRRYREILESWPQHEEALSDLAQIHSSRFRFEDGRPYYRRLLASNQGHWLARESLNLTNIFARPQITVGVGYIKMDGFDGSLLTKYLPVTAEIFAPFSQDLWAGLGYQWVKFDVPGKPSSANIGRVMARYSPSLFWHVDGYVSGLSYSGTKKSNVNFGAGVSYEWQSGLKGRIETGRQDLWQNAETIRRNISYHSYAAGAEYHVTRDLELTAGVGYWDYSDNNWNVNGQFAGAYDLLPFPHPLRVRYQLDAFGFDKKRVYFSPEFFAKNTFGVGWQHFLGFPRRKEYHGETPMKNRYSGIDIAQYLGWPTRPVYLPKTPLNGYSLDYGFSVDDENNLYHQVSASFAYAMTRRCHLHVAGMLIRANVVDQDSINGFVQCHL